MHSTFQDKDVTNKVQEQSENTENALIEEVETDVLTPDEKVEESPIVANEVEIPSLGPDDVAESPMTVPSNDDKGKVELEEEEKEDEIEPIEPERELPDSNLGPYNYAKAYFKDTPGYSWGALKKYYRTDSTEDNNRIKAYLAEVKPTWEEVKQLTETYQEPYAEVRDGQTYIMAENWTEAWIEASNHLARNAGEEFTYVKLIPAHKQYRSYAGVSIKEIGDWGYDFAPELAYKNYELNRYRKVDFELLLEVSGDQMNYDKVMAKKAYSDRLLSPAFVKLVASAQKKTYPEGYNNQDKYWTGLYTLEFEAELQKMPGKIAAEEARIKKEIEEEEARIATVESGERVDLGVSTHSKDFISFKRHGKTYNAYKPGLDDLLAAIRGGETETATDLCTDMEHEKSGVDLSKKEMEAIFAYLDYAERLKLLEMFTAEWWLFESQEKAVNQILKTTPKHQRESLAKAFMNKDKTGYKELYKNLRALIDNDDTRRDFYTNTEEITGYVDVSYLNDLLRRYNEKKATIYHLRTGILKMSDQQLMRIPWETRKELINHLTQMNNDLIFDYQGTTRLIKTAPDKDAMRTFLLGQNADVLVKIVYRATDKEENELKGYLDVLFDDEHRHLLVDMVKVVLENPQDSWDYEITFMSMPDSVYRSLSHTQNADIIEIILDGNWTDGGDEKTILRILGAIGGVAPVREDDAAIGSGMAVQYQQQELINQIETGSNSLQDYTVKKAAYDKVRQDFYDELYNRKILKELKGDFHGDNYDALERALSALNTNWADERVKQLENTTDRGKQDDLLAKWSEDDFRAIPTVEKRIKYLEMVLGKDIAENNDSWVGNPDEKTVLLIIETTPPEQLPWLFHLLKTEKPQLYTLIERSLHFSEYQELHKLYATKAEENFYVQIMNDPDAQEKYKAEEEKMQQQKLDHPKVIPFSDPGMLNLIDRTYEYDVSMREHLDIRDGKKKSMVRIEWYDKAKLQVPLGDNGYGQLGPEYGGVRYFDPEELIGVYHYRNDSDVDAEEGDIKMMPAINLFHLENKQNNRKIMELVDIASLVLALVGVPPGASAFIRALAMADIVLSAGNLIVQSYKEELPKDLVKLWDALNIVIAVVQIGQLVAALGTKFFSKLDEFEQAAKDAYKAGTITKSQFELLKVDIEAKRQLGKAIKEITQETDLARLGTLEELLSASPKLAGELKDDLIKLVKQRKGQLEFDANLAKQLEAPKTGVDPKIKSTKSDPATNPSSTSKDGDGLSSTTKDKSLGVNPTRIQGALVDEGLSRYKNIRSFLGNGDLLKHLSHIEVQAFTNVLRNAHPDVLKNIDQLPLEDFVALGKSYKANPGDFASSLKHPELFSSAHPNIGKNTPGSGVDKPNVEKEGGSKSTSEKVKNNDPDVSLGNKDGVSTEKVPEKYATKIDDSVETLKQEELFGDQATTFLDAEYRTVRTTEEVTTYRAFGGDATVGGSFVTTTEGASRAELALLDEWNNTMRFEARIKVPKGEKINIGKVGSQTSKDGSQVLAGGGDQIILPFQWDTKWVDEVVDLTNGNVYRSVDEFEEFVASSKKAAELDGGKAGLPNSNNGADEVIGGLVSHKQNYLGQIDDALKSSSKEVKLEGKVGDWFRDELVSFNKKIPPKTGAIGEIDVELKDFIIEVTVKKKGKLPQIEKYLTDPKVNPLGKKVILYSEDYNWRAVKDIEKAGGYVAQSKAELFDIISKVRSGN